MAISTESLSFEYPWFVITGGPGVGKTATVNALDETGLHTVREAARDILSLVRTVEQKKRVDHIRETDQERFQSGILCWAGSFHTRQQIDGFQNTTTFFDRGLPDALAFMRQHGVDQNSNAGNHTANDFARHLIDRYRYAGVFILEPLEEYEKDAERNETREEAAAIHDKIVYLYLELGYEPIAIPPASPKERAELICSHVVSQGIELLNV